MHHICVSIEDREIFLAVQRLCPWTQAALIEGIKGMDGPGELSGIPCDEDEYVGVTVEQHEESIGYLRTTVRKIVAIFRYKK
jgi:hypothetical protein